MYQVYGKDYSKTCELLHFLEPIKLNNKTIFIKSWPEGKGPGSGDGYKKTIRIIRTSAYGFIFVSFLYLSLVCFIHFDDFILDCISHIKILGE